MIGEIVGGGGNRYNVKINYDNGRIATEIGRLKKLIIELNEELKTAEGPQRTFIKLRIVSYQKKIDYLESQSEYIVKDVWDYTYKDDPLTGQVAVSPIPGNGDADRVFQIVPESQGAIKHPINNKPVTAYFNQIMKYWAEKWFPTFRHGILVRLNGAIGSVSLDNPIGNNCSYLENIPITECDGDNFETGDSVLVSFQNNDPDLASIVGFKTNPRKCDPDNDYGDCTETECTEAVFEFIPDTIPATADLGQSIVVDVRGGCAPYTWTISGTGWSIEHDETWGLPNLIHVGCGSGIFTCTCGCGTISSETQNVTVKSTSGHWVSHEGCSSPGPADTFALSSSFGFGVSLGRISGSTKQYHFMYDLTGQCESAPVGSIEPHSTARCTGCLTWDGDGVYGSIPAICKRYNTYWTTGPDYAGELWVGEPNEWDENGRIIGYEEWDGLPHKIYLRCLSNLQWYYGVDDYYYTTKGMMYYERWEPFDWESCD